MSVVIDENLVGIWYIQLSPESDWLASLSHLPDESGKFMLVYRFRYYDEDKTKNAFDANDLKNWYRGIITDTKEKCIQTMREAVILLASPMAVPLDKCYEILNDYKTMDEFMHEFSKLPFVNMKILDKDGKEIPKAQGSNTPN